MRVHPSVFLAATALLAAAPSAHAQGQPAAPPALPVLEVGQIGPDFALTGATRWGTLREPVRLSDYKGKTVVLAFFVKARTRG